MAKFTKFLFLSCCLCLFLTPALAKEVKFSGQYFIYSQDKNLIYGSGKILINIQNKVIRGQTLYLNTQTMSGKLFGTVDIKEDGKTDINCDEFTFQLFPFKYRCQNFLDQISQSGDPAITLSLPLLDMDELKQSSIFYELKTFTVKPSKKISGRFLIPYIMGIPSIPIKKLVINKGDLSKKTIFFLEKTNYSQTHGLSLNTGLNIYSKLLQSNYKIRFFERGLFGLNGDKRGLVIEGKNSMKVKNKEFFNFDFLGNSDQDSFNVALRHSQDLKNINYSVSHTISGQKGNEAFHLLTTSLRVKNLKFIIPQLNFSYDYRGSTTFKILSPLKLTKSLRMNFNWERHIVNNDFKRNDSAFQTSLDFTSSILSLNSTFNISKDLIESTSKKSFSIHFNLPEQTFLNDNFRFRLTPFYTFSALPSANYQFKESSPGFNFTISSKGILFPFGFQLNPNFTMYQIWDSINNNKTNFNYSLSLKRSYKTLTFALDYGLVSRFSNSSYWVEGYNMNNLSLRLEARKPEAYFLSGRFGYNNNFNLENITVLGELFLPFSSKLSTSFIYYNLEKRIATFEIYLEKDFRGVFKLRGGYSLALKRFFIDLVHSL